MAAGMEFALMALDQETKMYGVIQRCTFNPEMSDRLYLRIKEELIPILLQTPGFIACYWLESGPDASTVLGIFESQVNAESFLGRFTAFAQKGLALLPVNHDISHGEVKTYVVCGL